MNRIKLALLSCVLAVALSSYTTKTTIGELVWFEDDWFYRFVGYATAFDMSLTYGYSYSGSPSQRAIVGYDESREDIDFWVLSRDGEIITEAEIILDFGDLPTPDDELFHWW